VFSSCIERSGLNVEKFKEKLEKKFATTKKCLWFSGTSVDWLFDLLLTLHL